MKIVIDISKDRYDEIMSMDWKNCRRIFDEEIRAIHDGKALEQEPCEDAISRRDMALNIVIFYNKATGKKKTLDFLCKCVEGLPSVQPKTGWIPVSERLPEKNGQYLVTTASVCGALITIRSYAKKFSRIDPYDFRSAKGGGWYDYDSEFGYWQDTEVKAWIPLPQPFEGNTK